MATPYPTDLFLRSDRVGEFVDPQVADTVALLVDRGRATEPTAAAMAVACLGTTDRIIAALVEIQAIPDLLEPAERVLLISRLGLVGDAAPSPSLLRDSTDVLAGYLSLPIPSEDPNPDLPSSSTAGYALFPHQRRALAEARAILAGRGRAMLHMPTGSGKTRTVMNLVCEHLRESEAGLVLWIAPTGELLEQAAKELESAWTFLGNREIAIHLGWGGRSWEPEGLESGVLFASPQTLDSRQQRDQSFLNRVSSKVSLVVFDEAHQSVARTYQHALEGIAFTAVPPKPVLGLSATPGRTYVGGEDDRALVELYDHEKVILDTTAEGGPPNPVDYLIAHGYLAEPEFRLLGQLETSEGSKQPGMSTPDYLAFVAEAILDLLKEGHLRIIVFARSVDESDLLARTLRSIGILADSVNGNTPVAQRDTATRQYRTRSTTPRVLVNWGVFTAGFDAPQTSAVVIARPTRSLVAYSQMMGRAVRGPKAGGNKRAVIVTVVDPDNPEFGSIANAFTNWDGMWDE